MYTMYSLNYYQLCYVQWNAYIIYFQTLMAPSLLVDIRSLWFNLTEDKERIESRWQPAESVAAAARTAFPLNLVAKGRLFASCLPKNYKVLKQSQNIISLVDDSLELKLLGTSELLVGKWSRSAIYKPVYFHD